MSFLQILFWVLTIVFTAAFTLWVNKRSTEKKLTAYLDFISPLFAHVSPEVREDLTIRYQDVDVQELTQFRFIVTNEGEQPVGDYDRPLSLHLSGNPTVLSVEVPESNPTDLDVDWRTTGHDDADDEHRQIELGFPFLNSGDWFVLTGLVEGGLSSSDLSFSIREKNLPSDIPIKPSFNYSPPGLRAAIVKWVPFLAGLGAAFGYWTAPVEQWLQTNLGFSSAFAVGANIVGALIVVVIGGGIVSRTLKKLWPAKHKTPPFTSIAARVDAWGHGRRGMAYHEPIPVPHDVYDRERRSERR